MNAEQESIYREYAYDVSDYIYWVDRKEFLSLQSALNYCARGVG